MPRGNARQKRNANLKRDAATRHQLTGDLHEIKQRVAHLEDTLRSVLAAMSIASCINAVRGAYDFDPYIAEIKAVLPDRDLSKSTIN